MDRGRERTYSVLGWGLVASSVLLSIPLGFSTGLGFGGVFIFWLIMFLPAISLIGKANTARRERLNIVVECELKHLGGCPDFISNSSLKTYLDEGRILHLGKKQLQLENIVSCQTYTEDMIKNDVSFVKFFTFGLFSLMMDNTKKEASNYMKLVYEDNGVELICLFRESFGNVANLVYEINRAKIE